MLVFNRVLPAALVAGFSCLLASCTAITDQAVADSSSANKALVGEALGTVFTTFDPADVDRYFGPDYTQHNPDVPDGVPAFKGLLAKLSENPDFKATTYRVIADGDLVAAHSRYDGFGPEPLIAFDVFRVEDGRIVEHWDNLIPVQSPNPSGRTQVDGETEITDLDQTEANKARVTEFITKSLINHEEVDITQYISPTTYIQHNPEVADGLEGFGAFMKAMGEKGITMDYQTIHLVVGEGNFVLTASEGAFGGEPQAFYDLFRLEDGLIVEHWDVIAPMPGPDAKHNESGKF
jgi:predicted SnoaL-like aldol condensation-catalyzing enzyme